MPNYSPHHPDNHNLPSNDAGDNGRILTTAYECILSEQAPWTPTSKGPLVTNLKQLLAYFAVQRAKTIWAADTIRRKERILVGRHMQNRSIGLGNLCIRTGPWLVGRCPCPETGDVSCGPATFLAGRSCGQHQLASHLTRMRISLQCSRVLCASPRPRKQKTIFVIVMNFTNPHIQ